MTAITTHHELVSLIDDWTLSDEGFNYTHVYQLLEYLQRTAFDQYIPTIGPHPRFLSRLRFWLSNVSDDKSRQLLLRLLPHLLFFTRDHFGGLYRAAYNGPYLRYVITSLGLPLSSCLGPDFSARLEEVSQRTWFCPVTDSMDISNFYHANRIEGRHSRPAWITLSRFGDKDKILRYIEAQGIDHLVLLEDFVGTGNQIRPAVEFALSITPSLRVLLLPLITCPMGRAAGEALARGSSALTFSPMLPLEPHLFLAPSEMPDEPPIFALMRPLLAATYPMLTGSAALPHSEKPYGPYGYASTGSLAILHTNTPDNTLPILHHHSDTWTALFPRSARV